MDRLSHLAQVVAGRMSGADRMFTGFAIDTRRIKRGELFVALSGEVVDGHEFVAMAARHGAAGALVARWQDVDLPQVVVTDVLEALQRYTREWRRQFELPGIGITGSNGKTTSKEMLAAVLGQVGPVMATEGNLNNHIGVPLTLSRLRSTHHAAIVEMGANKPGEIAHLAEIAEPTAGIVTLAGAAHLEGFRSVETVAKTKGALFSALPADGLAVINADDDYADLWRGMAAHCEQLSFGIRARADVSARAIRDGDALSQTGTAFELVTPAGNAEVQLPIPGRHNVMNALGVAAVSVGLGLAPELVADGLADMRSVAGRLRMLKGLGGAQIVDDSYNANPVSVRAALEWLATQPGRQWFAFGDMAELGRDAAALHRQVGEWARELGIERLLAVGPLSREAVNAFGKGAEFFASHDALISALAEQLDAQVTLLVKGSRSAQMDLIVAGVGEMPAMHAVNGG